MNDALPPRGIRNNNPGNLDFVLSDPPWVGEIRPSADPRFCQFDTMAHGVRALADVLIGYQTRHHLMTIQAMINRWAPPVENNTSAYVTDVAKECGVHPQDLFSMTIKDNVLAMTAAIINHENGAPGGQSWVSDDDIQTGVDEIMP